MKSLWEEKSTEEKEEIFNFCEEYKNFISENKTERECLSTAVAMAKKCKFKPLDEYITKNKKIKPGDKLFAVSMGKMAVFVQIGSENIERGLNIVGSHIDSPRLDLKSNPVYENSNLALLDTHYYGGIKQYQWLAMPLSLHGVVCKKDGSKILLNIGDNENDPVFAITDLLPHLSKNVKVEKLNGEMLDILAGSIPANTKNDKFKEKVFEILKEQGIEKDDLTSSEIEVVPAGKARDLGFDRSMILGYGQDDRVCAFTSLKAFLQQEANLKRTAVCLLVDKEEVGSMGATGMKSKFFENVIAEIVALLGGSALSLRRCLTNSFMLSSDVTAGYDPNYPAPMNKDSEAYLAGGISFNKYTGSRGKYDANDANPEFIAKIRKTMDANKVKYQFTEMGKVDEGGGGTIAMFLAEYGMQVIDAGVPLLNMHAPWEISSKLDVYEAFKCYQAFYKM